MKMATCHPDKKHAAKGLCKACYKVSIKIPRASTCRCDEIRRGRQFSTQLCVSCRQKERIAEAKSSGIPTKCEHIDRPHHKAGVCKECYDKRQEEKRGTYNSADGLRQYLSKTYGITPEYYARMFQAQDGKCAICRHGGVSMIFVGGGMDKKDDKLQVDHDHTTNAIRALLCFDCNRGLGCFFDDPDLLMAAAQYIRLHKKGGG